MAAPDDAELGPLTARSVIATTLLGTRPPRLPVRHLVYAGSLFGIGEGAIRTGLWRMVAAGELESVDGWYGLAGPLLDRKRRVDETAADPRHRWDGTWELFVVTADRRPAADRQELRTAARALHLGEVREGVWARPDNLDADRLPHDRAVVESQCVRIAGADVPAGFETTLFDVDGWAEQAVSLLAALESAGVERDDMAQGFLLSIAVVRHLEADPLLPDELLPSDWPGDRLRRRYRRYDESYARALARLSRDAP